MSLLCFHFILLLVTVLFIDFCTCLIDDEDYVEDNQGYMEFMSGSGDGGYGKATYDEDYGEDHLGDMEFMSGSGDGGEEMPNSRFLLSFPS
jgi:hypothetical protein